MILEMQAAGQVTSSLRQEIRPVKREEKVDVSREETKVKEEAVKAETLKDSTRETFKVNDTHEKYETKISTMQVVDSKLAKDREILSKMKELVETTDFDSLTREEKVDVQEKLIKYVDDINKISLNTKFKNKTLLDGSYKDSDTDNNRIEVKIARVDSQTLGLSVDNISKLKLDSVRVAGENYMPPYTFDVTKPSGASTALSVIGTAISKIDSYRREVTIDIGKLSRYPECLEMDQKAYSQEQAKIRNAEYARRVVAQLQNSIRAQILEAQRSQVVNASESVVKLFMNS